MTPIPPNILALVVIRSGSALSKFIRGISLILNFFIWFTTEISSSMLLTFLTAAVALASVSMNSIDSSKMKPTHLLRELIDFQFRGI